MLTLFFLLFSPPIETQMNYEKAIKESQQLIEENESLRNRLRDVVNSPLSDAEKQQIIDDSQRLHSSAPASIALPNVCADDSDLGRVANVCQFYFAERRRGDLVHDDARLGQALVEQRSVCRLPAGQNHSGKRNKPIDRLCRRSAGTRENL